MMHDWSSWIEHALDRRLRWRPDGNAQTRCPLPSHRDNRPSFSIHRFKGAWRCFGCGASGGIRDLARQLGVPTPSTWR